MLELESPQSAIRNRQSALAWLAAHEWLGVLVAAPLLLFPTPAGVIAGAVLLGGLRLVAWRATGRVVPADAPGLPLLWLLGMAGVGTTISLDPALSLPRLAGVLLGIGAFYAAATYSQGGPGTAVVRRIAAPAWALLGGGAALAVLMPLVVDWQEKAPAWLPPDMYATWPTLFHGVLRDSLGRVQDGLAANAVAGMLAVLLPPVLALGVMPREAGGPAPRLAAGAAALMALSLLATQSRGGLLAAAGAVACFLGWRYPRLRAALIGMSLVGAIVVGVALWQAHGTSISAAASGVPVETQSDTALFRLALWDRALAMIADHPFTGVGLNNFPVVQARLYPLFPTQPEALVIHAHNAYLQAALDFGVPGLLALLAFAAAVVAVVAPALRDLPPLPPFPVREGGESAPSPPWGEGKVKGETRLIEPVASGDIPPSPYPLPPGARDSARSRTPIPSLSAADRLEVPSEADSVTPLPGTGRGRGRGRRPPPPAQVWLAGCGAGLIAFALFGLTDALAIGSRPGLLAWILAGLAVGQATRPTPAPGGVDGTGRAPRRLHPALGTLLWATASLAACTLLGMI